MQVKKMLFRLEDQKASKALKTSLKPEFIDIFEKEITSYNDNPNKGI